MVERKKLYEIETATAEGKPRETPDVAKMKPISGTVTTKPIQRNQESPENIGKPEIPEKPKQAPEDDFVRSFNELYGQYQGKPATSDYTPEEKAAMEKRAKRARWADAAIVLGRAMQGKDMQLDKTQSQSIRDKIEARNKMYFEAVDKNNQNKIVWDMNRNQEKIRYYQELLKREDVNQAQKENYSLKLQELQNETERLKLQRDELNYRVSGQYYSPNQRSEDGKNKAGGGVRGKNAAARSAFDQVFPTNSTNISKYIAEALNIDKDNKSGNVDDYLSNFVNIYDNGDGTYSIPQNVVNDINRYYEDIEKLVDAKERSRTEDISAEYPDPTQLSKMIREAKRTLKNYIKGLRKAQPNQQAQPAGPTNNPSQPANTPAPATQNKDEEIKQKWFNTQPASSTTK